MKSVTLSALVIILLGSTAACAQRDGRWNDSQGNDNQWNDRGRDEHSRSNDDWDRGSWSPDDRRPRIDGRDHRQFVQDPQDREELWRRHYSHAYAYDDDPAYTECRKEMDPAGLFAGAVIGGLLGNAASHGRGDATVAGVIAGGAVGAALTQKMDCDDRSYAYKTYSTGFNAGRKGASYDWSNPRNNHRGRFKVLDYYYDEDGFKCSVFTHEVYVRGQREEARGRACEQPNGSWAIID